MPQHKKLSQLPLRINPSRPKNDQEWQAFLAQLQQHFNAVASIDLCSGLTKFSDAVNAGYYMGFTRNDDGYDDGIPVLVVGNRGAEKYIQFDGSDFSLGRGTQLIGADAYSNASIFYHTFFESLDSCIVSGSVALDTASGRLKLGNTNGSATGHVYRVAGSLINGLTFTSGNIRFKTRIQQGGGLIGSNYYMVGTRQGSGSNGFGFRQAAADDGNALYGITRRSGTDTDVDLGLTHGNFRTYEAVLTAGSKVEWYVDDVKVGEQDDTSKLPLNGSTKNSGPEALFYIEVGITGLSSNEVYVGEWFTLHEQ